VKRIEAFINAQNGRRSRVLQPMM